MLVDKATGKPVSRRKAGVGRTNAPLARTLTMAAAKNAFVGYISAGYMVKEALVKIGRDQKTYERWRKLDEGFRISVDTIRATTKIPDGERVDKRAAAVMMGFAAFRERYLHNAVAPHQQQWVDVIEGHQPSDLHPAQTWVDVDPQRIIVNCPPEFAKTMTISVDYVVYRICCDPAVRIKIISATQPLAKQMLHAIKYRLVNPDYSQLQLDFGPEGGYKANADSWAADQVYLGRSSDEKDPTVQALGIGGQLYGARADLIILDDCTDLKHASEWARQRQYIMQEASSRLGMVGVMLVIGTRVAARDVYSELLNPENYPMGEPAWSYLAQPAILDETASSADWETLWPWATRRWEGCKCSNPQCQDGREDGMYPHFDGPHLEKLRKRQDLRTWALVYQQSAIAEDSTFPTHAVVNSINKRRAPGLTGGLVRVPEGCFWIGSMDPATTGPSGAIVYAFDKQTHKRYVVDAKAMKGASPSTLKNLIKQWSTDYPIKMWVVEKTGLNTYFTQDEELRMWLTSHGITFHPHYTGSNKWEPGFGIASMSALFGSYDRNAEGVNVQITEPLIELPRLDTDALKMLVNQLQVWSPESDPKKVQQDLVMALWFAEIQARKLVKSTSIPASQMFAQSQWLSRSDQAKQRVVNLSEWTPSSQIGQAL